MSNSGRKEIHVETEHDQFDLKGYTCELSATSFVPPTRRSKPKERNYFYSEKEVRISSLDERKTNRFVSFRFD